LSATRMYTTIETGGTAMLTGLLLVALLCFGPLLVALIFAPFLFFYPAYGLSAATALLAFGGLCISPLLSGRYQLMEKLGGIAFWYKRHMGLPLLIVLLSLVHYLARISLFPRGLQTTGGEIAFWILVAGVVNAMFFLGFPFANGQLRRIREKLRQRINFPYSTARLMHNLLLLVIFLLTIHISLSSLGSLPAVRAVVLIYGCGGLVLGLWPKLRRRFCKPLRWLRRVCNVAGISCFELESSSAFAFRPGQYGFFRLRGKDAHGIVLDGEPHPFSFTGGLAHQPDSYRTSICVKALGDFTSKLQNLSLPVAGSWEGPFGNFTPPLHGDCLMIAGGIGITPFLSWLEYFRVQGTPGKCRLLWTMKTEAELFCPELMDVSLNSAGLEISMHYSGADDSKRLTPEQLQAALEGLKQAHIYLCGPPAFMQVLTNHYLTNGILRNRIHTEAFSL